MLNIGCHLSATKGYMNMLSEALSIDANTFQFFTRNPRGGKAKELDMEDINNYNILAAKHGFAPIIAHAPYTLNPCAAEERIRNFTIETMEDDLRRLEYIPGTYYNFHPGSHVGQGSEKGIELICDTLNRVMFESMSTFVLLETMAGKGTEMGRNFEELKRIIDGTKLSDSIGVCLDTCHVYDAGYDIVGNLESVLEEFDNVVGLDKLKAIHVNDSKNPFSSHKDRHEKIGEGYIPIETFERIINHPSLRNLVFSLETPNDLEGYAAEIRLLRELYHE
ncbi:MAG: deoxyribonuclease IV [Clostridiales bacterium]|nr:deoxyribonuclease IV [Clostridiales bacterium]